MSDCFRFNEPIRTPNHPDKAYVIVAKDGEEINIIRFGEQFEEREWVGLDEKGNCVTRPYPLNPQMIKREKESMRKKCIVKDCENHTDQGGFTGDLCNPCHDFITEGKGVYSQAYRNAKREWIGLTEDEIEDLWGDIWGTNTLYIIAFGKELEAKLKEKNT